MDGRLAFEALRFSSNLFFFPCIFLSPILDSQAYNQLSCCPLLLFKQFIISLKLLAEVAKVESRMMFPFWFTGQDEWKNHLHTEGKDREGKETHLWLREI